MLGWLQKSHDVGALIARKQYRRAIQILEKRLEKESGSVHLRQLYADALWYDGRKQEAVEVLGTLVDEFADSGFVTKGIAVLKKIQRIDPEHDQATHRMERLIQVREAQSGLIERPTAEQLAQPMDPVDRPPRLDPRHSEGGRDQPPPPIMTSEVVLSELWFEEAAEEREDFQWSPLFRDFSKSELATFLGNLRLLVKKPGSIVYSQGQPGNSLFVLANGQVRVYARQDDQSHDQLKVLQEGAVFGKTSVLTGGARHHTVTAASECELLELDKETFDDIARHHPRVRQIFQQLYDKDPD